MRAAVTAIEGLGRADALHPLRRAFIEHDGFRCGYCAPSQIFSALGMIEEIKQGVSNHVTAAWLLRRAPSIITWCASG